VQSRQNPTTVAPACGQGVTDFLLVYDFTKRRHKISIWAVNGSFSHLFPVVKPTALRGAFSKQQPTRALKMGEEGSCFRIFFFKHFTILFKHSKWKSIETESDCSKSSNKTNKKASPFLLKRKNRANSGFVRTLSWNFFGHLDRHEDTNETIKKGENTSQTAFLPFA